MNDSAASWHVAARSSGSAPADAPDSADSVEKPYDYGAASTVAADVAAADGGPQTTASAAVPLH